MVQTQGRLRLEFGPGGAESVKGSPGDLVLIPKGVVHPEANPGPDPNQAIAFRVGEGKILVNADVIQAFAGDIQAAVSYPEDEHYLVGESTVTHDQVVDQLQPPSASGEGA